MKRLAPLALLFVLAAPMACGKVRAPYAGAFGGDTTGAGGSGGNGQNASGGALLGDPDQSPPSADAGVDAGICGNLIVPVVTDHPNLYFVLDASGSMVDHMLLPDSTGVVPRKYDAATNAIGSLLFKVGHRVSYGAALFPSLDDTVGNSCPPGDEVFPTQPGDPVEWALSGQNGPNLTTLLSVLNSRGPKGLTPTAASLEKVKSKLFSLSGKTYAFLLTDGAPNCNVAATCGADMCTVNIEGGCSTDPTVNCCNSANSPYDYRYCLDSDPTLAAVADLLKGGVETFIVGMPGTSQYVDLLDRLATAGGTARSTEPLYYPVEGGDDLTDTLSKIGLSVAVSCDVKLQAPPPDQGLVNVYLDKNRARLGAENGWNWVDETTIRISGTSCDNLKAGLILQVQVTSGCPSQTM